MNRPRRDAALQVSDKVMLAVGVAQPRYLPVKPRLRSFRVYCVRAVGTMSNGGQCVLLVGVQCPVNEHGEMMIAANQFVRVGQRKEAS